MLLKFKNFDLKINWSILVIFVLLWLPFVRIYQSLASGLLYGSIVAILLLLMTLIHELAHVKMANYLGFRERSHITLWALGGLAIIGNLTYKQLKPYQELLIAVAGPASNMVMALVSYIGLLALYGVDYMNEPYLFGSFAYFMLYSFYIYNLWNGIFNFFPSFPMDGGRILRSLLAMKYSKFKATQIAVKVGKVFAVVFACIGFFMVNPMLVMFAIFIWISASAEMKQNWT